MILEASALAPLAIIPAGMPLWGIAGMLAGVSYLLGSIPCGLWLVKAWKGIDVREVGSKNIGTTNVYRAAGKGAAAAVFLFDVGKGYLPVFAALYLAQPDWVAVLAGACAIIGHSRSLLFGFYGGKSVATGIGTILAISPLAAFSALSLFAIVFGLTRLVSAGSILAALLLPPLMYALKLSPVFVAYAALAAAYVVVRHRENIQRLFAGQERRL
jgi:glycerol-3-phosphate acyltransferase PlsY